MTARPDARGAGAAPVHAPGDWIMRLRIDPTAFVAPGAVVVGEVSLAARSSVWFNTVVRGDTAPVTVGEDSNVQDNSVVHEDEGFPVVIGARVTVGHRSIVHGCVIEDDCLIGMGSIVLTGARIGAGSLLGAGALVLEHQTIPPESLVLGSPAKVVGEVRPAHREAIRNGTRHYVELARSYMERGLGRPLPPGVGATGLARTDPGPPAVREWEQCLAVLEESPRWVAARLAAHPGDAWWSRAAAGRWSALEVLGHLAETDRAVFAPRLERLLSEPAPWLEDVDVARATGASAPAADALHREWSALRAGLVARLRALRPADWARGGTHAVQGPYSIGEMVRRWVDHDLAHRRQMGEALGEPR